MAAVSYEQQTSHTKGFFRPLCLSSPQGFQGQSHGSNNNRCVLPQLSNMDGFNDLFTLEAVGGGIQMNGLYWHFSSQSISNQTRLDFISLKAFWSPSFANFSFKSCLFLGWVWGNGVQEKRRRKHKEIGEASCLSLSFSLYPFGPRGVSESLAQKPLMRCRLWGWGERLTLFLSLSLTRESVMTCPTNLMSYLPSCLCKRYHSIVVCRLVLLYCVVSWEMNSLDYGQNRMT